MKLKLPVLLFHQQRYNTNATLFNAAVNNALVLTVVILNMCDIQVTSTITG
jgi:hypothetical protein